MKLASRQISQPYSPFYHAPVTEELPSKAHPRMRTEVRWIKLMLHGMLHITLVLAIISFLLTIGSKAPSLLLTTALLSTLSAICILIADYQISRSKCWMEICIMSLCSLYAPFFVILLTCSNLISYCSQHS